MHCSVGCGKSESTPVMFHHVIKVLVPPQHWNPFLYLLRDSNATKGETEMRLTEMEEGRVRSLVTTRLILSLDTRLDPESGVRSS